MKIAFATQDLQRVDAHFGWAKNIAVYEISPDGFNLVEAIQFSGDLKEDGNEDKLCPQDRSHQGLRHSLRRGHRRLGSGARGGEQDSSDQGERTRSHHRNPRQVAGSAQGHPAALAAQGDEQGGRTRIEFRRRITIPWERPPVRENTNRGREAAPTSATFY